MWKRATIFFPLDELSLEIHTFLRMENHSEGPS